jgi:CheY-like chemotaxis protein
MPRESKEAKRARAMAAGFDLHLTKPIDLAALEHALDFKRSA